VNVKGKGKGKRSLRFARSGKWMMDLVLCLMIGLGYSLAWRWWKKVIVNLTGKHKSQTNSLFCKIKKGLRIDRSIIPKAEWTL
jgi:hypothetical protein